VISRAAEYALRIVLCLAKGPGLPVASRGLAAVTGVPASYQAKLLQALRRAGIVEAHRGFGGGFVLARPAETLSVQDVIDAVDPRRVDPGAPPGADPLWVLRRRLRDGIGLMESLFASISIAELSREERGEPGVREPLRPIQGGRED
jgi:Rrf2 family nitric oxide-sensitive transcriptional repressor